VHPEIFEQVSFREKKSQFGFLKKVGGGLSVHVEFEGNQLQNPRPKQLALLFTKSEHFVIKLKSGLHCAVAAV